GAGPLRGLGTGISPAKRVNERWIVSTLLKDPARATDLRDGVPEAAMKKTLASLLLVSGLGVAGCTAPEAAKPIEFPRETPRSERKARDPEPTREVLAPVDRWHAD